MSKKKRSAIRFHISTSKPAKFSTESALRHVAQQFMGVEKSLTPLIIAQHMPPGAAIILIACYTHATVAGAQKTHNMSEDDITGSANSLLTLWKHGLFTPSKQFPYTLKQVFTAINDDEDGSEDEQ